MTTDNIVVYQSFQDPINANIVKGLLESYGFECFLSDEYMATLNTTYSPAIGGVKLNVFERDIDRITALLKAENMNLETDSVAEEEDKVVICPNCKSTNVGYCGSVKKKFGLLSAIIFSLLSIFALVAYPFYQRKTYHCFDCNQEFKKVKP